MEEEEQDQMDGGNGAQMDEEEEDEDGSPDGGNGGQGMTTDDYEEIDYKICGELGKLPSSDCYDVCCRGEEQST
jgi:hypothetical protein